MFVKFTSQSMLLFILICGCGCQPSASEKKASPEVVGVIFREGKGLEVADETAKSLGLEIVGVTDQEIVEKSGVPIQIYREASVMVRSTRAKPNQAYGTGVVSPELAKQIQVDQEVALEVPCLANGAISGKVLQLNPYTEIALGGVEVIVQIPDPEHRLKVGSMLHVQLGSRKRESVRTIPTSALLKTATGTFAYVVNDKYLFRTPVVPGSEMGEMVEIKDGLYEGDQVVKKPVPAIWMAELQAIKGGVACADGH